MTLVAVWVQRNATLSELVAISDSRIDGGEQWDRCPKIVPLPRPATAIAMSGDATPAYAFLLLATNACLLLDGNEVGRTDIKYLAHKLRDIYADSRRDIGDLPKRQTTADVPTLDVVLFGWSWRRLRFEGYSYSYDQSGSLVMKRVRDLDESVPYGVCFAGDASREARARLHALLKAEGAVRPRRGDSEAPEQARKANLKWQPLEVLQGLIDDHSIRSVGGVPQMLKIYQYGLTETFVWRTDSGDFYGGREVKHGERSDRRIARFVDGRLRLQHSDRSIASESGELSDSDEEV